VTNELLIVAICAAVVCLFLMLRSFIIRGSTKPDGYQVWIMTPGDDDPGKDPSDLDEWPSEIEVPTNFFIDAKAEAACVETLAAGKAGMN
jgi:hypothetical protein